MNISHIGIEVRDLENMRYWYMRYFALKSSEMLSAPERGIKAYFLQSSDGKGCEIELIHHDCIEAGDKSVPQFHLAVSTGSEEGVRFLTELLRTDGNVISREPFINSKGCLMAEVLDPEGNHVELTV